MASKNKTPRPAVSPLMRQPRVKEKKVEEEIEEALHEDQPESLAAESLAPDDSFVHFSAKLVDWVLQNRKVVGTLVGIVLVASIGMGFYISNQQGAENNAAAAIFKAVRDLPGQNASAGDDGPTPEDYKVAALALSTIADDNPGLKSGKLARLYSGSAYLEGNDPEKAVTAFESALKNKSEPVLRFYALSGLASARGAVGNDAGTIEAYQQMTDELTGIWKDTGLIGIANSYEGMDKKDLAADTYEKLLTDSPYSSFSDDAKTRLKILRPQSAALKVATDFGEDK